MSGNNGQDGSVSKRATHYRGKPVNPITTVDDAVTLGIKLAGQAYKYLMKFNYLVKQSLGLQLIKSTTSVPSNISEGKNRFGYNSRHFFDIAKGSAQEAQTQIRIAQAYGLMRRETSARLRGHYGRIISFLEQQIRSMRQDESIQEDIDMDPGNFDTGAESYDDRMETAGACIDDDETPF
jgi:four helix bundle protein